MLHDVEELSSNFSCLAKRLWMKEVTSGPGIRVSEDEKIG
jgi:hypothetical protein